MGYKFMQRFPGNTFSGDTLRLVIVARKMLKQNLNPKDINHVELGGIEGEWNLVAPTDIQDQINHTWEAYHSFQGRAAQLVSDTMASATSGLQVFTQETRAKGDTDPAKAKVDSPMVYTGSDRLQYSFLVPFMRWEGGSFKDVYEPIHWFKKLSCASLGGSIDTIDFPAIFTINTEPKDFITLPYAALKSVQTTYQSPFVDGYPQRAECTLTFEDIRPLYREWIQDGGGGKVTVGMR